jgi:hypothetical protein
MENCFKTYTKRNKSEREQISAVHPEKYAKRFKDFMRNSVLIDQVENYKEKCRAINAERKRSKTMFTHNSKQMMEASSGAKSEDQV